jgi:hypothetical protein
MKGKTMQTFQEFVKERFGGSLSRGRHDEDEGAACLIEAINAYRGRKWSDDPGDFPDVRSINDAYGDNYAARTDAMLRLYDALAPRWGEWTNAERLEWIGRVIVRTVREIIADLPDLPEDIRERLRAAGTLAEAARATAAAMTLSQAAAQATALASMTDTDVSPAVVWTARAAAWTARAYGSHPDKAVTIWIEEAMAT